MKRSLSILSLSILAACGGGGGADDLPAGAAPVAPGSAQQTPVAATPAAATPSPAPSTAATPSPTPVPAPVAAPRTVTAAPVVGAPAATPSAENPDPAPAPVVSAPPPSVSSDQFLRALALGVPLIPTPIPPGGPSAQRQWLLTSTVRAQGDAGQMWIRTLETQPTQTTVAYNWTSHDVPDGDTPTRLASVETRIEGGAVSVSGAPFLPVPNPVPLDQSVARWDHGNGDYSQLIAQSSDRGSDYFRVCWLVHRSVVTPVPVQRLFCGEFNLSVVNTGAYIVDDTNGALRTFRINR